MGKMSELAYDIEQLYIEGLSVPNIADQLRCDKTIVLSWISEQRLGSAESDFDTVMTSTEFSPFATVNS
jgi:hypothetical protein